MLSERVGLQAYVNNLRAKVLSEYIKNHVMPKELAINRGCFICCFIKCEQEPGLVVWRLIHLTKIAIIYWLITSWIIQWVGAMIDLSSFSVVNLNSLSAKLHNWQDRKLSFPRNLSLIPLRSTKKKNSKGNFNHKLPAVLSKSLLIARIDTCLHHQKLGNTVFEPKFLSSFSQNTIYWNG